MIQRNSLVLSRFLSRRSAFAFFFLFCCLSSGSVFLSGAHAQGRSALDRSVEATEPNRGGVMDMVTVDTEVARQHLKMAEGYAVNLFASEQNFPIGNPVAMTFDARGRLWVITMPAYPHREPGVDPDDKLIILEDTDGDGRADKHTVFADGLYQPVGFELGDGGAYVSQPPNLLFLRDTDGDDVADERRVLLHGFGTEDSHHAIHSFVWGPGGALYFQEGTFHHSQVETPYGPVRMQYAGVFRYEPRSHRLERYVSYRFANPWGHEFDRWGQNFISDASNGNNYFGLPLTGYLPYPEKHPRMKVFTTIVRPTAGSEFVSSRHFPEKAQGDFLYNNVIGFHGIKQHRVRPEGSGFAGEEVEPLLTSTDINFRPVDMQFGPDGALYIVDWFNPLVGHMQYSLRDARRDKTHGRIWRITHEGSPLLTPPEIAGRPIGELLDLLKTYEDQVRYRVRRELRLHDADEVQEALGTWIDGMDPEGEHYEHYLLEALWVHQTHHLIDAGLLEQLLDADDHRARAAATRVLRHWRRDIADPLALLARQVGDPHPLVRLEAVVALSYMDSAEAAFRALEALDYEMDYYLDYGLNETIRALKPRWQPVLAQTEPSLSTEGIVYLLRRADPSVMQRPVFARDVYESVLRGEGFEEAHRAQAVARLAEDASVQSDVPSDAMPVEDDGARAEAIIDALSEEDISEEAAEALSALLLAEPMEALRALAQELPEGFIEAFPDSSDEAVGNMRMIMHGLIALAIEGSTEVARETGNAARMLLDSPEQVLAEVEDLIANPVERDPDMEEYAGFMISVLRGGLRIPSEDVRLQLHEAMLRRMDDWEDAAWRDAALEVLAGLGAAPAESFAFFAGHLETGRIDPVLVAAADAVPAEAWGAHDYAIIAQRLIEEASQIPAEDRHSARFRDLVSLAEKAAARLDDSSAFAEALRVLQTRIVEIATVEAQMIYDVTAFRVAPGQQVEIVLRNADVLPHNLVIVRPGAGEMVGRAADAMATDPDAFEKEFIPDSPAVMYATGMLQEGESARLRFTAPEQEGNYPYICTFPAHWITMKGVMEVVAYDEE